MKLPSNGVAKDIRHYSGALLIFFFIVSLVVVFIQFPVLDSNKEVVMMLVGTLSASLAMVVSTIVGSKPDDINALKASIEKKDITIQHLTKSKDDYESIIINLQKEIIKNQDNLFDKFMLKTAIDYDDRKNKNCSCDKENCACSNS
tara:strand:+ start:2137 stop:2574 length:438 start_codon:yes stop_codon:yes gene_type:complete